MTSYTRSPKRSRRGRALVECIVSALLLAVTTLALATTTKGTLALADDARLISRAQAYATSRVENALTSGCTTAANGTDGRPRIGLTWQQTPSTNTSRTRLDISLNRTPIATNRVLPIEFAMEGGAVCQ